MKTLYIIDDNQMMRTFLAKYFEKEFIVKTFETAEEALTCLRPDQKPALMILDYELEGLSGYDTLKQLKASGFYKDIPVMFLSGKQKSDIRIDCLRAGADDFIMKPFNPEELSIKVAKHLSHLN